MDKSIIFILIFFTIVVFFLIGGLLYYFFIYKPDVTKKEKANILGADDTEYDTEYDAGSSIGDDAFKSFQAQIGYKSLSASKPKVDPPLVQYIAVDPTLDYIIGGVGMAANMVVFHILNKLMKKIAKFIMLPKFEKTLAINAAKSAFNKFFKELAAKGAEYVASYISFGVRTKGGAKVVSKLQQKIIQTATDKIMAKAAAAAAKTAIKQTTMVAMKAAILGAGPIGVALFAFEMISMAIDLSPANHYKLLGTWQTINEELKKGINDMKLTSAEFPPRVGPLDAMYYNPMPESNYCRDLKLPTIPAPTGSQPKPTYCYDFQSSQDVVSRKAVTSHPKEEPLDSTPDPSMYDYLLEKGIFDVMQTDTEYTKTMNDILAAASDYNLTDAQFEELSDQLFNLKMETWILTAGDNLCINNDGTIESDGICMYTKKGCDTPHPTSDADPDRQWSTQTNRCLAVSATSKSLCDEKNLDYDIDKGICRLTKRQCIQQVGNPTPSNIGMDDPVDECELSVSTKICGAIFGETLCATLAQLTQDNQFEPCAQGDTTVEGTIYCQKTCGGYINSAGLCRAPTLNGGPPDDCVNEDELYNSLCYKKCKTPNGESGTWRYSGVDTTTKIVSRATCARDCGSYGSNYGWKDGICRELRCPDGFTVNPSNSFQCDNVNRQFPHSGYAAEIDKSACSDLKEPIITGRAVTPTCTGSKVPTHKDQYNNPTTIYAAPSNTYSAWNCNSGRQNGSDPINWPHVACDGKGDDECLLGTDPCDTKSSDGSCCRCGDNCQGVNGKCYAKLATGDCDVFKERGCPDGGGCLPKCKEKVGVKCTRTKIPPTCEAGYKYDGVSQCNWDQGLVVTRNTKYLCGTDFLMDGFCYSAADANTFGKWGAVYDGTVCGGNHTMKSGGTCYPKGGEVYTPISKTPNFYTNPTATTPVCKPGTSYLNGLCYKSACPEGTKMVPGTQTCTYDGTLNTETFVPKTYPRKRIVAMA